MDAQDFKSAWELKGDTLYRFTDEEIGRARTTTVAEHFLTIAGLPVEAAPCLSFGRQSLHWLPEGARNDYLAIGSDGAGNPIVIDGTGAVLLLDHDRKFEPSYVNRDVPTLAASLLQYRDLIDEAATAPDFDGALLPVLRESFVGFLEKLDPRSLEVDQLWSSELRLR